MKRIIRILVLAVAFVTGLTTVSAQTIQVQLNKKYASPLPSTVTSYLDDPFRYFNVIFIVTGAGSEGLDVFIDMNFTVDTQPFFIRTRPGSVASQPIHLSEGMNMMKTSVLHTQVMGRPMDSNFDYSNPLGIQQLPEGTYELCLDFYEWTTHNPIEVVGPCPTFEICYSGSAPELASPLAGAQLSLNGTMVVPPARKINFFWSPVMANCASNNTRFKYQLKMVKVLNGQNYNDAIKYNPTVFSTEVRNNTLAVLDTLRDVKVHLEKGALYVAQVRAEQIKTSNSAEDFIIANDGVSQPMPFYWGYNEEVVDPFNFPTGPMGGTTMNSQVKTSRTYGYVVEDESEEGSISKGVSGLTLWEGGVGEESELETIIDEMKEQYLAGFIQDATTVASLTAIYPEERKYVPTPKRYYVESDGYYTVPMTDDLEISFMPLRHNSLKKASYIIDLYDYMEGGIDSITAYMPLLSDTIEEIPERYNKMDSHELISRTLEGWGSELVEGGLYYLQLTSSFTVDYWQYLIADTSFYVNEYLAEHIRDTISREFMEDELMYSNGIYFQWGNDPDTPEFTTPQWKAPVDRSGDDIYDPMNHAIPASVPEVKKAKTFPVSWTSVKNVTRGDKVEYELNVYELKPEQTLDEAIATNKVLVTRTLTDANSIPESDTEFFKVFSPKKTYVMTLSAIVDGESDTFYHFENGNEALPIVFKVVK